MSELKERISNDKRLDPRLTQLLTMLAADIDGDVKDREELLKKMNSPRGRANLKAAVEFGEMCNDEVLAPSEGLNIYTEVVSSSPDNNSINLQIIRPATTEKLPILVYIHGGGMMMMSCYDGNYKCWGRLLAHQKLIVVMVDFRNSIIPSSVPEVGPFPCGLNDCVSAVKWANENSTKLGGITGQVYIAGESGGGNLAIATSMKLLKDGDVGLVQGVYPLCPYLSGQYPREEYPSISANNGYLISVNGNNAGHSYGIKELENGNPLAWPHFATIEDIKGLPPVRISVNELDPLRDEGVAFYRKLLGGKS